MANVLHLLEADADFQTQRLAAALTDRWETVGPGGRFRDVFNAARWLKRQSSVDIIHAWGTRPLIAAAMAGPGPIIYTPPAPPDHRAINWLKRVSKRRDVHVICDSHPARTALCLRGLPLDKCHAIAPGVRTIPRSDGSAARRRLGLAETDFVLLAPGESTRAAGHRLSLWTAAILHELSPGWKLLVWGRGPLGGHLERLAGQLNCRPLLHFAPGEEFENLLAAADVALITAGAHAAVLPLAICMAAALPIVATPLAPLAEARNALLAEDRSPRTLAQQVLELRRNPPLRKCLGDAAKQDALCFFDLAQFRRKHAEIYDRVLIRPGS
jgi:glycosyltransferase involved in cell wall biosynthesis